MALSEDIITNQFDPTEHPTDVYDAFTEFVASFQYKYQSWTKEPPPGTEDLTAWHQQNKRKYFLGRFASRNLQRDFKDLTTTEERDTITFNVMVTKLKERYEPTKNTTIRNFQFHAIKQEDGEAFDTFVNKVKHEAAACNFKCATAGCTVPDTMARDQIIIGTNSPDIQRNALKEQWNLKDLITNGRLIQAATIGTDRLNLETPPQIGRVGKKGGRFSKKAALRNRQDDNKRDTVTEKCQNCSSNNCRGGRKCWAYDKECFICKHPGHVKGAKACKGPSKGQSARRLEDTKLRKKESESEDSDSYDTARSEASEDESRHRGRNSAKCKFVASVRRTVDKRQRVKKPRYQVEVVINEQVVNMFADTGADISVMSVKKAEEIGLALNKTKMKIRPYGAKPIKCKGYYVGPAMHGDAVTNVRIYVVDKEVETLLSGQASEALGIIKFNKHHAIRQIQTTKNAKKHPLVNFPEVFEGVGKLKGHSVKLYVDTDVPPVAEPPRPIAFHLQKRHDEEINKMEKNGIIEEHIGPAPYVSNTVPTPKEDGGLRITVDMRNANKAIKSTNLPIPRPEAIRARLAGSKWFSKCDFTTAFHQLELEPESRYLTVFHDGQGRLMRYTRLTMGTSPASGELNKALTPLFRDIAGAHVIHDDLILATETEKEHQDLIIKVMEVISKSGMTLNPKKCHFTKTSIPFWGMIIGREGVKPEPEKVESLKEATAPKDKAEVMSFLCMIQSYAEFIPNLSQKTENLRNLTKKNKRFLWNKSCQQEFDNLRNSLHKDATLRYFDPNEKT